MKELVRAIKRAGKRKSLVWLRDGEFEYIQMGLISVKTERLQAEELGALVSFFGEIPRYDMAISQRKESTNADKMEKQLILHTAISQIFECSGAATPIINTNVLIEDRGYLVRAFLDGDEYRYIYEEYMELLRDGIEESLTKISEKKASYIRDDKDDNGEERYLTFVVIFREVEKQNPFLKELQGVKADA